MKLVILLVLSLLVSCGPSTAPVEYKDSVSVSKEIKYLKIGEEFDDCPIFYIDPKKRYVVTCYNHFTIYVIKSGYTTNASGKFNQVY